MELGTAGIVVFHYIRAFICIACHKYDWLMFASTGLMGGWLGYVCFNVPSGLMGVLLGFCFLMIV